MGRLAVYGAGAARLHEEIIPVTAIWTEAERERKPLRPLGESGEERTLNQLEEALRDARAAPTMAVARIQALVERDIADLVPALERIADERLAEVKVELAKRGEAEARSLAELLEQQRKRIAKANAEFDPNQLLLPGIADDERREREADRRHWQSAARAARKRNPRRAGAHPRLLRCSCASAGAGRPRLSLAGVRVTRMAAELKRDPDLEWLDHVQPVGLVVAPVLLKELGLAPSRQTQADTARRRRARSAMTIASPRLHDPWAFFEQVLGWEARHVAGSPGGPPLPDELLVALAGARHDARARPGRSPELGDGDTAWQLLVRIEAPGVDPDARGALEGWEATPHQRFERLLRETGVFAGLLITRRTRRGRRAAADLRAAGETSG